MSHTLFRHLQGAQAQFLDFNEGCPAQDIVWIAFPKSISHLVAWCEFPPSILQTGKDFALLFNFVAILSKNISYQSEKNISSQNEHQQSPQIGSKTGAFRTKKGTSHTYDLTSEDKLQWYTFEQGCAHNRCETSTKMMVDRHHTCFYFVVFKVRHKNDKVRIWIGVWKKIPSQTV